MKGFILSLFVVLLSPQVALSDLSHIPDADDDLHVYALPVGQGDCTVIQCPRAGPTDGKGLVTIIDAGASNSVGMGKEEVAEFLSGTRLNFVVLTHSHLDHHAYIDYILEGYKTQVTVYHSCQWDSYNVDSPYASPVEIPKCDSITDCATHQPVLSVCPGITLAFVASALGECKGNRAENEDSIISKITYAGVSTLISGDFEGDEAFMKAFLAKGGADISSDIYRLCHHGAFNGKANTAEFLNAVGAKYVFSSSGYRYNHPRCEVYNYYNDRLADGVVAEHPYTCFNKDGIPDIITTTKAIYVTSVIREVGGEEIKSFYVVKFDINSQGAIAAEAVYIGDEPNYNNSD